MGFSNCFFSLDDYLGRFTPDLAPKYRDLLEKYKVVATAVEVVGPQPLVWDFSVGRRRSGWCRGKLVPRGLMLCDKPLILLINSE